MGLIIAGSTSGTTTIDATAIAGTGTLTLPTGTDTLVGKATTDTLTNKSIAATQLTGTVAVARLPAGSVLQVVSSYTSATASASSSAQATVLEQSITPISASNKVLISYNIGLFDTNAAGAAGYIKIRRGGSAGTVIPGYTSSISAHVCVVSSRSQSAVSGAFIDSPATTSSTTYGVYILGSGATAQEAAGTTIILMEIAG